VVKTVKKIIFLIAWLAAIFCSYGYLIRYSSQPGLVGSIPSAWPEGVSFSKSLSSSTLLIFVHPQCPCTQATASELDRLLVRIRNYPLMTYVVLFWPTHQSEDWQRAPLVKRFAAMPRVKLFFDADGKQAQRFGAKTSGQVILYDTAGNLQFRGGITGSRGHEGDNLGLDMLEAKIKGLNSNVAVSHVFGCALSKELTL
jgi:hypothetical protein